MCVIILRKCQYSNDGEWNNCSFSPAWRTDERERIIYFFPSSHPSFSSHQSHHKQIWHTFLDGCDRFFSLVFVKEEEKSLSYCLPLFFLLILEDVITYSKGKTDRQTQLSSVWTQQSVREPYEWPTDWLNEREWTERLNEWNGIHHALEFQLACLSVNYIYLYCWLYSHDRKSHPILSILLGRYNGTTECISQVREIRWMRMESGMGREGREYWNVRKGRK